MNGDIEDSGDSRPAWNGRQELSGVAVAIAWRNAQNMTQQGYKWAVWETFEGEAGSVFNNEGDPYHIWLPGVLSAYPEGRCSCPYFAQENVCKHLYFAVEQANRFYSPAASWEAVEEWHHPNSWIEPGF